MTTVVGKHDTGSSGGRFHGKLLSSLTSQLWAAGPELLGELRRVVGGVGSSEFSESLAAAVFSGDQYEADPLEDLVVDGVAVVPVHGVITQSSHGFLWFRAVSCEWLAATVTELAARGVPIVLDVRSPGGSVAGVSGAADAIYAARESVPVVAVVNELAASCGCWLASQADEVVLPRNAHVGAIGVYTIHRDVTEAEKSIGVKTTVIRAGKYKADHVRPLTTDDREHIQHRIDVVYSNFIDDVARGRGVGADSVVERMADARIFTGAEAVEVGLADRVATLGEVLAELSGVDKGRSDDKTSGGGSVRGGLRASSGRRWRGWRRSYGSRQ